MTKLEQLRARLAEVRDEMRAIAETDAEHLTEEQDTRFAELERELEHTGDDGEIRGLLADIETEERRAAVLDRASSVADRGGTVEDGSFTAPAVHVKRGDDVYEVADRQSASTSDLRSAAMEVVSRHVDEPSMAENAERLLRRDPRGAIARHVIRFSNPVYERAWAKVATGQSYLLDAEEQRALAVGQNADGGFLVPTHLDPTVLLTNDGTINPYRRVARVVTLAQSDGNVWNGVTSAGVTAGDAQEAEEASDNSPSFGGTPIPVHAAHAFVAASYESFQDIGGLASDVAMMLNDARGRLDSARFATGTSADVAPTGVFTALENDTSTHVEVDSQGTFAKGDVYKLRRSVPPRFRGTSVWNGSLEAEDSIRQMGTNDDAFTVDLTAEGIPQVLGKEYVESSEAPTFQQATNGTNSLLIYGDFSNFVIVDKVGMSVEFIPNLFGASNRPTGQRGWYARWRRGSDVVRPEAFKLLVDPNA